MKTGELKCEYMFGMLNYGTWNIYDGDEWVAQVMINSADKNVVLTLSELGVDPYKLRQIGSYNSWSRFITSHIRPRTL